MASHCFLLACLLPLPLYSQATRTQLLWQKKTQQNPKPQLPKNEKRHQGNKLKHRKSLVTHYLLPLFAVQITPL